MSTISTCRLFSKIFSQKVICSPSWLNTSPQLSRLLYCMSINKWQQQNGFISSNNQSCQLKTAIMTNNNNQCTASSIDILAQQKMNLHHISAKKCSHPRETLDGNFPSRIRLHPENNIASRISCCWSSTDDSSSKKTTTALTVFSELKELKTAPLPALALGFSGLIPFVSAPIYMIMTSTYVPVISFAQTAYGAVILSFLGGVRWGHAVGNQSPLSLSWTSLGQSVVPSLAAWPALLLPLPLSTLVTAGGIGVLAYFDIVASIYEPWFKALRFVLSFVAVIALWSSVMCHLLLSQNQTEEKEKLKPDSPLDGACLT